MTCLCKQLGAIALLAALSACSVGPPVRDTAPAPLREMPGATAAHQQQDFSQIQAQAAARFDAALKLMKEQSPDALPALITLSKDFPQYSGPLTDLGILYAQSKQRAPALTSFEAAVAANPNNAVAQNWLGTLYREGGDYARAERCYQKATAQRPDYADAHLNLAILYDVAMHRPQQALSEYRAFEKYGGGNQNPMVAVWIKELETVGSSRTTASIDVMTTAQSGVVR